MSSLCECAEFPSNLCPENIGFLPSVLWYITPTYSSGVNSKSYLLQEVAIDCSNEKIPLLNLPCTSLTKFNICCLKSKAFPGGSMVKKLPANVGDTGLIPGLGRSPGRGNGNSLRYPCLENAMDKGSWWATVHRVPESGAVEHAHMS